MWLPRFFLIAWTLVITTSFLEGKQHAVASDQASLTQPAKQTASPKCFLKGGVSEDIKPFLAGPLQSLPKGAALNMTVMANINSETSQIGDPVKAMVSLDVKQGKQVVLPGQWYLCGQVTNVVPKRRLGRNGYVDIKFDKLLSPDGKIEVPIEAIVSTKECLANSVAKMAAVDSVYLMKGAVGGALLSVQLTGVPLAIATQGYSVAAGAAAGAGLGAIAALWRKGHIASVYPGDEIKFKITKPVALPTFNPEALPSASPPLPKAANFDISISKSEFKRDPFDKLSRLLLVTFQMDNKTDKEYSLGNVVVISDHNHIYYPYILSPTVKTTHQRISPQSLAEASLTFGVDSPKHKYWLVLLDNGKSKELMRIPVN